MWPVILAKKYRNATAQTAFFHELKNLRALYNGVIVPYEVCKEVMAGGAKGFAIPEFMSATWLTKIDDPITIPAFLKNTLDVGESSNIQTAIERGIKTVCIDETTGKRIARLNGLSVTGTIGILLRAKKEGFPLSLNEAIKRMQNEGVRLCQNVIEFAIKHSIS